MRPRRKVANLERQFLGGACARCVVELAEPVDLRHDRLFLIVPDDFLLRMKLSQKEENYADEKAGEDTIGTGKGGMKHKGNVCLETRRGTEQLRSRIARRRYRSVAAQMNISSCGTGRRSSRLAPFLRSRPANRNSSPTVIPCMIPDNWRTGETTVLCTISEVCSTRSRVRLK